MNCGLVSPALHAEPIDSAVRGGRSKLSLRKTPSLDHWVDVKRTADITLGNHQRARNESPSSTENVISDAGAVRCRIVGAEDIHSWPQAERAFNRDLELWSTGQCDRAGRRRRR